MVVKNVTQLQPAFREEELWTVNFYRLDLMLLPQVAAPVIPKTEIDLHGKTVDEAIRFVEEFLKESYNTNLRNVRIIHGKGIGVLR